MNRSITTLVLALLIGTTACEQEEPVCGRTVRKLPVTIAVQTDPAGATTKALGPGNVDEDGIHTLNVYILNDKGEVEESLTERNFTEGKAQVELTEGPKTICAVANAGKYGGAAPDNTSVNAQAWLENTRMPMSTTADTIWTVSAAQEEYEVRLNRMVAKMNVRLVDERTDRTDVLTGLTIQNLLAEQTTLYRTKYGVIVQNFSRRSWSPKVFSNLLTDAGETFYLHEVGGSFKVEVKLSDNSLRLGTFTKAIPRNFIFPLVIHIADYRLRFEVKYKLAAIGTEEVTKPEANTYKLELPEGCTFEVTMKPEKPGQKDWFDGASWGVNKPIDADNSTIVFDEDLNWEDRSVRESITLTGMVEARPAGEALTLPITIRDGADAAPIQLKVVIAVRPLGDGELSDATTRTVSAAVEAIHIDL